MGEVADGVGDVDYAVVVRVAGVPAGDLALAEEERSDGVRDVGSSVVVAIAAQEIRRGSSRSQSRTSPECRIYACRGNTTEAKLGTVQFSVMLSKGRYEELSEKIVAYIKDNIPEAKAVPEN